MDTASRADGLRAWARQRRQHREFRISPRSLDLALLRRTYADRPRPIPDEPPPGSAGPVALREVELAQAATSLWRADLHAASGERTWQSRQTRHHLRACRDALTEAGVVIQDHDGVAFHRGLSVEVLTYQDDADVTGEVVLETVRPTVYLHDRRIQMGQVVVGRPGPGGGPHE